MIVIESSSEDSSSSKSSNSNSEEDIANDDVSKQSDRQTKLGFQNLNQGCKAYIGQNIHEDDKASDQDEDLNSCHRKPGIYLGDLEAIQIKSSVLFDIDNENLNQEFPESNHQNNETKNMLDLPPVFDDQFKFVNDPFQQHSNKPRFFYDFSNAVMKVHQERQNYVSGLESQAKKLERSQSLPIEFRSSFD